MIKRISQKLFKVMTSMIMTKKNNLTYCIKTTSLMPALLNYAVSLMQQLYRITVTLIYYSS